MEPAEDSGTGSTLPTDSITSSTRAAMSTQHRPRDPELTYGALSVEDDVVLRGAPASQAPFNPALRATTNLPQVASERRAKTGDKNCRAEDDVWRTVYGVEDCWSQTGQSTKLRERLLRSRLQMIEQLEDIA